MVKVNIMKEYMWKGKNKSYPPLYDAFELGERVKRIYKDKTGKNREYKGIVLAIDENSIEVYWDTKDGKYSPENTDMAFTNCQINEIFNGTEEYSPIKKDT